MRLHGLIAKRKMQVVHSDQLGPSPHLGSPQGSALGGAVSLVAAGSVSLHAPRGAHKPLLFGTARWERALRHLCRFPSPRLGSSSVPQPLLLPCCLCGASCREAGQLQVDLRGCVLEQCPLC